MSDRMNELMLDMFKRIKEDTIRRLSEAYGFEYVEGNMLDISVEYMVKKGVEKKVRDPKEKKVREPKEKKVREPKEKKVREPKEKKVREPKEKKDHKKVIVLPFNGDIMEGVCHGLKVNHGLHTQCMMKCSDSSSEYCNQCEKQCGKNSSGKPNNGTIEDRVAGGVEYKDVRGRNPVAYATVMRKLKITREEVEAEVLRLNLVFDVTHFEDVKKVNKSDDAEMKRGRPKRVKTMDVVSTEESTQDIWDVLMSEVESGSNTGSGPNPDVDEVEEEGEEFEFEGVVYLRALNNKLYDKETQELKGTFNEERQMIEDCKEEEESDEDEEEDRC